MPNRNKKQYVGLDTREADANTFMTKETEGGVQVTPRATLKDASGMFTDNFLNWLVDARKAKRADLPEPNGSIYELKSGTGAAGFTIALAADWASDTPQSAHVGFLMGALKADYTIHLGDTYYSGSEKELRNNFYSGDDGCGYWPRGSAGSFALLGNHEMYSGAGDFFKMIQNQKFGERDLTTMQFKGQPTSYFCLRSEHWCILGLDTGYDSLENGEDLDFPQAMRDWLLHDVKLNEEKRGIIVLTHHQYVSGFKTEEGYLNPAARLKEFFPDERELLWIWGHEHRFAVYGKYKQPDSQMQKFITAYGRCIGNSGMPDEHLLRRTVDNNRATNYHLVAYDYRVAENYSDEIDEVALGYNAYAVMHIQGNRLDIKYYTAYATDGVLPQDETGEPVPADETPSIIMPTTCIMHETWTANNTTGAITCLGIVDGTAGKAQDNEKLSYFDPTHDITWAGKADW